MKLKGKTIIKKIEMEIRKIRIKNFRSIKDSKEWYFHRDRIQVLIGKNASGKSSIIDALQYFNTNISNIQPDDRPRNELYTTTELSIEIEMEEKEINHSNLLEPINNERNKRKYVKITKFFTNYDGFNYKINGKYLDEYVDEDIKKIIQLLRKHDIEDQYLLQLHNYYHNLNKMSEDLEKLEEKIKDNQKIINNEDYHQLENLLNKIVFNVSYLKEMIKNHSPLFIKFNYRIFSGFSNNLIYDEVCYQENKIYQLIFDSMKLQIQDFIREKNNSHIINQLAEKRDKGLESFLQENWIRKQNNFLMRFNSNYFECLVEEQGELININQKGDAEIWLFTFLVYIYNKIEKKKTSIILIDEPNVNLHPNAQRNIIILMEKFLIENPNLSIIYTTHSPYLVPPEHLDRVLLVMKSERNGTYIKQLDYQKLCNIKNRRLRRKCSPKNIKARLLQMLTISIREGFFGNIVVLCEGPTEFLSLPIWASLLGKNFDEKGIILIQTAGKYIMIDYAELFSIFDIPVFLIFDNDRYSKERWTHKKLNRWLLQFCGEKPSDYPSNSGDNYFVFDPYFEKQLRRDDFEYRKFEDYVSKKYGIGKKKGLRARFVATRYLKLNKNPPNSIIKLIESIFNYQEKVISKNL